MTDATVEELEQNVLTVKGTRDLRIKLTNKVYYNLRSKRRES